jgi:hypothetical protein
MWYPRNVAVLVLENLDLTAIGRDDMSLFPLVMKCSVASMPPSRHSASVDRIADDHSSLQDAHDGAILLDFCGSRPCSGHSRGRPTRLKKRIRLC